MSYRWKEALLWSLSRCISLCFNPCDANSGSSSWWYYRWCSQLDFFPKLYPSTSRAAHDDGLVYDLVGRGLYNPIAGHFVARYVKAKNIYTYDGMKHGGYSVQEKNAKLRTHMYGGNVDAPPGYRTHVVIYHLHGGPEAQSIFYCSQVASACQHHNLEFSTETLDHLPNIISTDQDFVRMEDEDCFWMTNPYSLRTSEYILANTTTQSTPPSPDHNTMPPPIHPVIDLETPKPDKAAEPHLPSTPESLFPFNCRCGAQGDGNTIDHEEGPAIRCDECGDWSHIACQQDGRASNLTVKAKFICDFCSLNDIMPSKQLLRVSERWYVTMSTVETCGHS